MHPNVRGSALFAAIALGRLSLADVPNLVRVGSTFDPDPAGQAVYEPLYQEFTRLYGRLHRLYARLNR